MSNRCCFDESQKLISTDLSKIERKIYLEVTTECNNNCFHCFNRSGALRYALHLDDIITFEKDFHNLGNITQILLSGGEFFVHPQYMDILKFLVPKYNVKILSNGKHIPDDFLNYWSNHHTIELQITLNGPNKEIDGLIRGSCFDETVASIKKVIAKGLADHLTVTTTLFRANIHQLRPMLDFCCLLGVKRIQFSYIRKIGRASDNWDRLSISNYEKIKALSELYSLSDELQNKIHIVTSGMRLLDFGFEKFGSGFSCEELSEEFVVTPDGNSVFCPHFETYLKCKNLKIPFSSITSGTYSVANLLDENCKSCPCFEGCVASCLMT